MAGDSETNRALGLFPLRLQPELDQPADGFGKVWYRLLLRSPGFHSINHLFGEADDLLDGVGFRDPDYLKRIAETALEEIIAVDTAAPPVDPIYAAIEAHRAANAAYDQAAEAPDDENQEAFRKLDIASQQLMRVKASTLAGLIALLRYAAPLLQDAGAPGFPIEIPFAGRWSAAFGTFCANVANSLAAIVTAGSAAMPERIDRVAEAIVEATAPLIDDFEVARRAARAAIEAIAS